MNALIRKPHLSGGALDNKKKEIYRLKNIDFKDLAILIDFDGTMTTEDTNNKLIDVYGDDTASILGKKFREGKISFPEYFQGEMSQLRLTEDEYIDFLLTRIEISPGFLDFYKKTKEKGIRVGVISGGFENGIIEFLKKHGIEDMEIFANRLVFDQDKPRIDFLDGAETICCDRGPCGNCKVKHYNKYKEDAEKVIFIGDGVTDMPVAEVAEIVFAKEALAQYLDKKGIEYIKYEDFTDINNIIFN